MKRIVLIGLGVLLCQAAFSISVSLYVQDQVCSTPGYITAGVSGGVPPYTYLWSTGATTQNIFNLAPGTYTVTVTDAVSDQNTAQGTVIYRDHTQDLMAQYQYSTGDAYCPDQGHDTPFIRFPATGSFGPLPYTFNGEEPAMDLGADPQWYYVTIGNGQPAAPGEVVEMQFMDGNGCPGNFALIAGYPVQWPLMSILDVQGACAGSSTGSFTVMYSEEGHHYDVGAELRNMQDEIVYPFDGSGWHGVSVATQVFTGLAAGDYRLIQRLTMAENTLYYDWCSDEITVTIPDLGTDCGSVIGTVYMDYDQNCVPALPNVEPRVPDGLLEFTPGPYFATSADNGVYGINLPNGSYSVQQIATQIGQHCIPLPITVTVNNNVQTVNFADTALVPVDAMVAFASGAARPGFQLHYTISQHNLTPATTGATSIAFTFDPAVSYVSATPPPSNVNGNVITWDQGALGAFQGRDIYVTMQVPPDVGLVGTALDASVTLSCANDDADLTNNAVSSSVTVTASLDPNEKVAQTSSGLSKDFYFIDADEYIDYTLRFQNTGNDTAFTVIVTDTLPATLDPGSIIWGASSHVGSRSLSGQGIVKFIFANILLPDSNSNEDASHGFASFRIRPRLPLTPGTQIENTANIYFDFNPPVITDPSVLMVEFNTSVKTNGTVQNLWLMPNPTSGSLEVRVSNGNAAGLLQVVSVDGRVVLQRRMEGPRAVLDVSQLSRGLYTLNWHDVNGTITTQRFVRE